MAHLSNEPTTKEKLATIVHGFDDFDTEMRKGTRASFHLTKLYFNKTELLIFDIIQ